MEREEREQKERERREQKAYEKEQRRIAKETARAAKEAARIEEAAIAAADNLAWKFFIPSDDKVDEGDEVDEPFELMLMAKKKAYHQAAVVDVQNWEALEVYLRAQFEVDDSIKRIKLVVKVELDGEVKLRSTASDGSTLANVHFNIVDLGKLLLDAKTVKVTASVAARQVGKKLKAKAKARSREQETATAKWKELKESIYGTGSEGARSYTTGEWKAESSDIMRREHGYLTAFFDTRDLTAKVMGCADYHPAPSVLICPFEGCKKGRRQLNGSGLVSQLFSHWQSKVHEDNPAAKKLEARWRLALDNKNKTKEWLDARESLILSNEEMDTLGGEERGYQRIRGPSSDVTDFSCCFALHTEEHRAWLQATGTI